MIGRIALAASLLLMPNAAVAQKNDLYQSAVSERLSGHTDAAVRMLSAWLSDHPDDADAWLQLGFAELASGQLDKADTAFRRVLALAPNYADARSGLELVAQRRKITPPRRNYLGVEGAASSLSGTRQDWLEEGFVIHLEPAENSKFEFGAVTFRRFGLTDLELNAAAAWHPSGNLWMRGSLQATPSADFRPHWGISVGTDWRTDVSRTPVILGFDWTFRRFPTQDVVVVSPSVTKYLADGRYALTLHANGVLAGDNPMQFGVLARADFMPRERTRVYLGVASGPDTELGVVTNVSSVFAGGEVPLSKKIGLIGSVTHEWRSGGGGIRDELRLGMRFGF